jgi:hypothetical protein
VLSFGGSGVNVLSTTVASATSLTAAVQVLANADLGFRDVRVTTGGEVAVLLNGFQVTAATMPQFLAPAVCGRTAWVNTGMPQSIDVAAQALNGLSGQQVMLSSSPLPAGMTASPAFPILGQPAQTILTWTPSAGQAGTHTITLTAIDQLGQVATCMLELVVVDAYVVLGTASAAIPLLGDDVLYTEPAAIWPISFASGFGLDIPNDPGLVGVQAILQVGLLDPVLFPSDPLRTSNALLVTVGVGVANQGLTHGLELFAQTPPAPGTSFQLGFRLTR